MHCMRECVNAVLENIFNRRRNGLDRLKSYVLRLICLSQKKCTEKITSNSYYIWIRNAYDADVVIHSLRLKTLLNLDHQKRAVICQCGCGCRTSRKKK